jgi:hypothetical protein
MSFGLRILVLSLVVCGFSVCANAQEHSGARVSGFYSGAFGEGDTNIVAGGSVGYRFTPRLGLDFEVLALPDFQIGEQGMPGRGVAFLTNFVTEFPSPAAWLTPYIQGGGGVANIRLEPDVTILDADNRVVPFPTRNGRRVRFPELRDGQRAVRIDSGRSDTSVALSVGGGVDFTMWRGLAVGPNITFMKFFGSLRDIELTRIGGRASFRF